MAQNYLFVSCDIVAHSAEVDLIIQRDRIVSLNSIISEIINSPDGKGVVWSSGGDGGHLGFPEISQSLLAINLILRLYSWGQQYEISLRIIGCYGPVEITKGADERVQLVGHGINQAGRLLGIANAKSIFVTEGFYQIVKNILPEDVKIHDPKSVELKNFGLQRLFLFSKVDLFQSTWTETSETSDLSFVKQALKQNDFLEVIYRARRLIQINANDSEATNALRTLALKGIQPKSRNTFLYDLFLDIEFGPQFINAGSLIERKKGEILCQFADEGETMFFLLKGQLAVYLPTLESKQKETKEPDFKVTPGELTGEIAFALRRKRSATLRCIEDSALLSFSYNKILLAFSQIKTKEKLAEILNRHILARVLENFWNTAPYLTAKSKFPSDDTSNAPWLTLLPFTTIVTLPWRVGQVNVNDTIFKDAGLLILASGKLEKSRDKEYMDGVDYPILFADFLGEFQIDIEEYHLTTDIKIICIRKEGFFELDRLIFDNVLTSIKRFIKSNSETPIGSPQSTTAFQKQKENRLHQKYVFLSYCRENLSEVSDLRDELLKRGMDVWWDQDILAGRDWKYEIRQALKHSHSFVLCLSVESERRNKSGIYPEAFDAIASYREYAPGSTFLIPIRLSDCEIPPIEIDSTRTLDRLEYVNLFPPANKDKGIEKLIKAIRDAQKNI